MIARVKRDKEIEEVQSLAKEIWTEHYTPIIGQDQVRYMLERFQSREAIKDQIENKGFLYFLIRKDRHSTGYLAVRFKEDELFLSKFYVKKEDRRKGYGREAMAFIEDLAREKGLKKITLTVNKKNTDSIKAYHKMGFKTRESLILAIGRGFFMDDFKLEKHI